MKREVRLGLFCRVERKVNGCLDFMFSIELKSITEEASDFRVSYIAITLGSMIHDLLGFGHVGSRSFAKDRSFANFRNTFLRSR